MSKAAGPPEAAALAHVATLAMPEPESDDLGRYLEDTITIDWQTPTVSEKALSLLEGVVEPEARVARLFEFVRDEITHSRDVPSAALTCSASDVLRERTGLSYAKSHLLAAFLRIAGFPTGFCYARLAESGQPGPGTGERTDRFVLHGFNAVYWKASDDWIFLDARGDEDDVRTECRFEPPWRLSCTPDPESGEAFLPLIYRRPAKRIIDLLDRAPSLEAACRSLPDSI